MQSKPIPQSLQDVAFEAPIPGQSLTNSPENNYAWEQKPKEVNVARAREKIFLQLLEPKNLEEVQKLMINEVPVDAIAQTLLVEGFRKGQFNPDLALQLLEPTMYMLLAIAEKSGIEPTLDIEDEEPDEDEAMEIMNDSKSFMQGPRFQDAKVINPQAISVGRDIKKQLDNLNVDKVKASILQKPTQEIQSPQPETVQGLLSKTGV
mgnify:CR=1 FL=1|tara:strand:- start:1883 stop:2500 length:618 start_codon:yes stop_codon:yes gene_type:complete